MFSWVHTINISNQSQILKNLETLSGFQFILNKEVLATLGPHSSLAIASGSCCVVALFRLDMVSLVLWFKPVGGLLTYVTSLALWTLDLASPGLTRAKGNKAFLSFLQGSLNATTSEQIYNGAI